MRDIYEEIVELRRDGRRAALVTLIARSGSAPMAENAKMLVIDDGRIVGTVGGGALEATLAEQAREVLASDRARTASIDVSDGGDASVGMICGGSVEFLIEPVSAPPAVLIVGAGHVGKALARALSGTSFRVEVMDDRPELLSAERLPGARLVHASTMHEGFRTAPATARTLVVIATRSHDLDLEALREALDSDAPYIGLLGSRTKARKLSEQLTREGARGLDRVRCPVGLSIGADDPAEIAIAIAAELIAVRRMAERAVAAPAPAS